jgi:flagellar protein FliS
VIANPYQQYRATAIETASPLGIIVLLYQGVLRFTQRGIQAVERRDVAEAHTSFVRAQAIVLELAAHLDMEAGGEPARNLNALYVYANRRLVEANVRKEVVPAVEVVRIFRELLPAWQSLAEGKTAAGALPAVQVAAR